MTDTLITVPADWRERALIDGAKYDAMYAQSLKDPDAFWAEQAKRIDWIKPFTKVKNVSWDPDDLHIKWFEDGTLNVSANCIDRHLPRRAKQTAIIWEGDDPKESRHISYEELHREVCRFANVLKAHNVKKGDRVTIYLPMIPEAAYAMLACARIGAVHSVVFAGFSPDSLAGRILDCESTIVLTADEGMRGGKPIPLKVNTDLALTKCPDVKTVIVVKRTGAPELLHKGRDFYYHEEAAKVSDVCPPVEMKAEDPLFILYTSGSTGKPKGVLHTSGGYAMYTAFTHQYVFDYHEGDIYWCTADVGWVTGHSYIVYGPLANGATTLMFEGVPNYPTSSRFWEVIDKHQVNTFYTAPTALRALMREGEGPVKKTSRASLRLLGSVGEPINPEAWLWYHRVVGDGRCPIVDTWWQTETGGILISPLPGATDLKPGSATKPLFGIVPQLVDADGKVLEGAASGNLCLLEFLARPDAHRLWRSPALHRHLLQDLSRQVLHRRRLPPRRRRLLLDHRPRRRRDQRLGPSPGHGRSRKRARRAPRRRRGRGRRLSARHQGPGHLCLCHAEARRDSGRRAEQRTQAMGGTADRSDRPSGRDPVRAGPAQDPLRQDHAPHPAQDRRRRHVQPRRYVDAGRSRRGRRPRQERSQKVRSRHPCCSGKSAT